MENFEFPEKVIFTSDVFQELSTKLPNRYYSVSFYNNYYIWTEDLSNDIVEQLLNSDNILQFNKIMDNLLKKFGIKLDNIHELPKQNKLDIMRDELIKVIDGLTSFTIWYRTWLEAYYPELLIRDRTDINPIDLDSFTSPVNSYTNNSKVIEEDSDNDGAKKVDQTTILQNADDQQYSKPDQDILIRDKNVASDDNSAFSAHPQPDIIRQINSKQKDRELEWFEMKLKEQDKVNLTLTNVLGTIQQKLENLDISLKNQNIQKSSLSTHGFRAGISECDNSDREFKDDQFFSFPDSHYGENEQANSKRKKTKASTGADAQLMLMERIVDKLENITTTSNKLTPIFNSTPAYKLRWPKQFKLKDKAFENYNWMISFERCLKTNGVTDLLGKVDALGSLFSDYGEDWIRIPKKKSESESWKTIRELFFKKFVAPKGSALEKFKRAVIKPSQSPEQFLKELQMLADISGITEDNTYDTTLKERFCRGLANAHAYTSLPLYGRNCDNVDQVLAIMEEEEMLDGYTDRDLTYEARTDCPFTKSTLGYHVKTSDRRGRPPERHSGPSGRSTYPKEQPAERRKTDYDSLICNTIVSPDEEDEEYEYYDYDSSGGSEEEVGDNLTTLNTTTNRSNRNRDRKNKVVSTPTCTACQASSHTIENCYAKCRKCKSLAYLMGDEDWNSKLHLATEPCPLNSEELKKLVSGNSEVGYPLNL